MSTTASDLFSYTAAPGASAVRVGIGGWVFPAWRKNFYPAGLVQARELQYASRHLRTIEINGTFYRAPAPSTYAKWRGDTPDGFVFSLKAPRYITETTRLADAGKGIARFIDGGLAELGDRLGPILWQLPPRRAFDRGDIAAFMDLLPRELDGRALRHALEVRHTSFLTRDFIALARDHRLATVYTDSPDHPSFADPTGDFIYARLMHSRSASTPAIHPTNWTPGRNAAASGSTAARPPTCRVSIPTHPNRPRRARCSPTSSAPPRNAIPPPPWRCNRASSASRPQA